MRPAPWRSCARTRSGAASWRASHLTSREAMQAVTGTSVRAVPRSVDARTTAVASAPVRNLAAARGAAVFRGSSARVASSVRAAAPTMGASRKATTCMAGTHAPVAPPVEMHAQTWVLASPPPRFVRPQRHDRTNARYGRTPLARNPHMLQHVHLSAHGCSPSAPHLRVPRISRPLQYPDGRTAVAGPPMLGSASRPN
jgi:hypothetical protein